ncbi:MAG: site-2 protease family protein [Chloroflexi bacterium]|nr:MAG: site-2 protease family protein [Chloroflexota bacterium]
MGINVVLALMIIGSFLVAIPLHESGHALMASMLGDRTPREEGRLSLSLRSHIDPIGTLMCVLLAFQPGLGVGFGWGKPVKADPWKMRVGANAGVLLVAWAGLIFSLLIGVLVSVLLRFVPIQMLESAVGLHIIQLLIVFASVNICLAIFNLFPLYPLDGYQIVYTLLPSRQAVQFAKSAAYGPLIILALFFLLPFLAQLASPGLSSFPLFQLPLYIWLGSMNIIALVMGQVPNFVIFFYSLR